MVINKKEFSFINNNKTRNKNALCFEISDAKEDKETDDQLS